MLPMPEESTLERARSAKRVIAALTQSWPEVNGVGLEPRGESFAVRVNLSRPLDPATRLPTEVHGIPVVPKFVGKIAAQPR